MSPSCPVSWPLDPLLVDPPLELVDELPPLDVEPLLVLPPADEPELLEDVGVDEEAHAANVKSAVPTKASPSV